MKAFKKQILTLFSLILVLTLTACNTSQTQNSGVVDEQVVSDLSQTYTNEEFGFELNYPENYEIQEGIMGLIVAFMAPLEGDSDDFRENMNVLTEDISGYGVTMEEYANLSLENLEKMVNDFGMVSSDEITLAGHTGYRNVYTGTQGQYDLKWLQMWTLIDDTAYILSYTAKADEYDTYLKEMEAMMSSFRML